jgi:cytochrome c oxidase subunit 2
MDRLKTKVCFAIVTIVTLTVAAAARAQDSSSASSAGAAGEITMTAQKYKFSPNLITVKKDDHVKLVITALDRDHGFRLDAFKVNQKLKKGKPTTIEFTADKAGTFPFQCSDFCGMGHGKMKGKLVVEE